jgi:putative transposase
MSLPVNTLICWSDLSDNPDSGNHSQRVERVLRVDLQADIVIVIDIFDPHAFPVLRTYQDITQAIIAASTRVLESDPYSYLLCHDDTISEKHKWHRDAIWDVLAPALENETAAFMLQKQERGSLIRALSRSSGKSRTTLIKSIRRWWQCGRVRNAFLPNFKRCGAPGERRLAQSQDAPKLGRPSALEKVAGQRIGIRITQDIERRFKRGIKMFYETPEQHSLDDAFDLTIAKFFHQGFTIIDGTPVPIIPSADNRPTFKQFRYWYETVYRNPKREKTSRSGEREYNLSGRALLGDSTLMAFGPGSLFQIDATIGDIFLVSSLDRSKIIGRPVIYFCGDVFSRTIAGFSATLEGPSWLGAMLALDNVVADKVLFCAKYGIKIEEHEWPCHNLPEGILADRGEFEGYNPNNLINSLGVRVHNAGPYRADWKGIIERHFGIANEKAIKFTPGYVPRPKQRGDPDYALKAIFTLEEFSKLLIRHIVDFNNNHYLKRYKKDEYMIADHVERYPLDICRWGISNRSGHLLTRPQEIVRLNLLPRKQVSITPQGIHFGGELYYTCDLALREGWFERARIRGNWKIEIAYETRSMDYIYLPLNGGTRLEVCHLTPAARHLIGRDWHEVTDYFEREKQSEEAARTRKYQSKAKLAAQKTQIISEATEKTQAAQAASGNQSKRARRRGIRDNRATVKEIEREQNAWILGTGQTDLTEKSPAPKDGDVDEYIPPSSKVAQLRAVRDKEWGKYEEE